MESTMEYENINTGVTTIILALPETLHRKQSQFSPGVSGRALSGITHSETRAT